MGTIGLFNIILGIIIPKAPKVDLQPEPSGTVKLLVDKVMFRSGKFRFDNYELVSLEDRLVMKRLISWKVIQVGFVFFALIGGLIGGLTGLSLHGFLEQRKRDQIRDGNEFTTVSRGDVEILYGTMSQVQLNGVSFKNDRGRQSLGVRYGNLASARDGGQGQADHSQSVVGSSRLLGL